MDRNQFSEFYDENIQRVFRFIYLRVDTAETAQDLTSLVFLKFWQRQTIQKKNNLKVLNQKLFFFKLLGIK